MKKKLLSILCCFFALSCLGQRTSDLEFTSSHQELNEAFRWAKNRALSLVITDVLPDNGGPIYTEIAYWGSYAHDPQYCTRDIAHQLVAGHLLGLDVENFAMMRKFASTFTESSQLKCNDGWMAWKFDFYGTKSCFEKSLTSPFDNVQRSFENYLWSGDSRWINDQIMSDFYQYTMVNTVSSLDSENSQGSVSDFLLGNGVVGLHPDLGNASYYEFQGNKVYESGDSFGAQYQATLAYAEILRKKNNIEGAVLFDEKAAQLKSHFERNWYSNSQRRYISGFEIDGTPRTEWAREGAFFMPLKKLINQGSSRGQDFLDYVHVSTINQGINIEAKTYYAELFYNNEQNHLGWHWLLNVMRARSSYPEAAFLSISNTIEGLMGVRPDAPNHTFFTIPRLIKAVDWAQVDNILIGENKVTVRHDGSTSTTATNKSVQPIRWEAQFYGSHPELIVNGEYTAAAEKQLNGKTISYVSSSLINNAPITVSVPTDPEPNILYLSDTTSFNTEINTVFNETNTAYEIMMVGDRYFTKGISLKYGAEATYNVEGYSMFQTEVGVDRGSNSSVNFQIWNADTNEKLYESGSLDRFDKVKKITLDIRSLSNIKLVAAGHNDLGSAIWGDARLVRDSDPVLLVEVVSVTNSNNAELIGPIQTETFDYQCDFDDFVDISNPNLKPCDFNKDYEMVNAGEEVNFNIRITNTGISESDDIDLDFHLGAEDIPYITINEGTGSIGRLSSGEYIEKTIKAQISENTPKKTLLEFGIVASDGSVSGSLVKTLTTPYSILHFLFDDFNEGINNNVFSLGRTTSIDLLVQNLGRVDSDTITATWEAISGNELLETQEGVETRIPSIPAGGEANVSHQIKIRDNGSPEGSIKLRFSFDDGVSKRFVEKNYRLQTPDFKTDFISLINRYNNLPMIGSGQHADYTFEVRNTSGIPSGEDTQVTITRSGDNASLVDLTQTSFDLGVIYPGSTTSRTVNFFIDDSANTGDVVELDIEVSSGAFSNRRTQRFVVNKIYVSDMPLSVIRGRMNRDFKQQSTNSIRLGGRTYHKGLGIHAPSEVQVPLNGQYSRFTSIVGVDERIETGSVEFNVYDENNNVLYHGGLLQGSSQSLNVTESIDIDVSGVQRLTLEVTDGNFNGNNNDHANWGSPELTLASTSSKIWLEAESAKDQAAFAPFVTQSDPTASNDEYIVIPNGVGNKNMDSVSSAGLTYNFNMSGNVNIWVRVYTPNAEDDSFWFKVDDESYTSQNHYQTVSDWGWIKIKENLLLSSDAHVLSLAAREDGTKIDKFLITTDLDYSPIGKGENARTLSSARSQHEDILAEEQSVLPQIIFYPNPTKYILTIESTIEIKSIKLFDLQGKHMDFSHKIINAKAVINTEGIRNGIYIVRVTNINGESVSKKIVIE